MCPFARKKASVKTTLNVFRGAAHPYVHGASDRRTEIGSAAVQPDTIDKPGLPIGVKILPEPDRLWGVLLVLVFNFICVCQNVAYGGAGEEILADSVLRCLVSTLRSVPPSASLSVPRNPMFLPL